MLFIVPNFPFYTYYILSVRHHTNILGVGGPQQGSQPGSQDGLCRPLKTRRKGRRGERGREEGGERETGTFSKTKHKKNEATSQSGTHSDPTQVARTRRSQIVLCDTRAIQQQQDAVCRMSQTPWRCIVFCVF